MFKPYLPYLDRLKQPLPEAFSTIRHRFELAARTRGFVHIYHTLNLSTKRMLDIGCSYGEFLVYGNNDSIGITTLQKEVDAATSIGLHAILGNVNDRALFDRIKPLGHFDVFYTVNIFEHVDTPHIFLRGLFSVASDDTILVLGVPVFPNPPLLIKIKKFAGSLADEHINFFTKETLMETARRAGWHIESCRPFIFKNHFLDQLVSCIAPQQYIIARRIPNFQYPQRKLTEIGDRRDRYFV